MQPQVPINVDPKSGVWSTGTLPMLYVPRHFFLNNHKATEQELGQKKYADLLFKSGHKSAYQWCASESLQHNIQGMEVFKHYLSRLSERGWAQFKLTYADEAQLIATIEVQNSTFVLGQPEKEGRLCYMFQGWFAGAMDWVSDNVADITNQRATARSIETECCGEGYERCLFEINGKL